MARVQWQRGDYRHNIELAERLLSSPLIDDVCIALDVLGYKIAPRDGDGRAERWALIERAPICPSWCIPVAEQERDARRGQVVAAEMMHRVGQHAEG